MKWRRQRPGSGLGQGHRRMAHWEPRGQERGRGLGQHGAVTEIGKPGDSVCGMVGGL